ncbi:hypothetical protein [Actinoplanes sp. NPDC051851]|uniref:hypothetical protein n=1 Tax=Actinoplanes sp. NPDC051851 TaxID=3154753 RepID=UPI003434681C
MIVQLNRGAEENVTRIPAPAADPVVAVFGQQSRVGALPQYLPSGWSTRRLDELGEARPGEMIVLSGAKVEDVRLARAILPRDSRVVALIDDWAPAELVAGVLTAGADVCVRGGHPAILAGHLVACRRRQLTERWASFELAQRDLTDRGLAQTA